MIWHFICTRWPELGFGLLTLPWSFPIVVGHLRWELARSRRARRMGYVHTDSPRAEW